MAGDPNEFVPSERIGPETSLPYDDSGPPDDPGRPESDPQKQRNQRLDLDKP